MTVRYFRTPSSAREWANKHGGTYVWERVTVVAAHVKCDHPSGAVRVDKATDDVEATKRPAHWFSSRIVHPDEFEPDLPEPVRGEITTEPSSDGGTNLVFRNP